MNFRPSRRRADVHIDLTPMIDCMFMVVLFLVVSTTFTKSNPGIEVDLPRASSEQTVLSQKDDLDVWVSLEGTTYVDDEAVDTKGLDRAFERAAKQDPNILVVIKADTGVQHGKVVAVMDAARNHGLNRLAIATDVENQ